VKTSVERIDETTLKLTVTVEAERVGAAVDEAARHVAKEVRVPGFRPGKAPRRVLESHVGRAAILDHAARDAVPVFYREAVEAEELEVLGQPEFEVETFDDGEEGVFSATVEVRPDIDVPDFEGLQIAHPEWEVDEAEVDEQLDQLRQRFAELATVDRPAQPGDHVVLSMTAEHEGEPLEEVAEEDVLYGLGDPEETEQELDRQLVGTEAGQIVAFRDTLGEDYGEHAGKEVDLRVIAKEVKATELPDLDDDFAITASEFDTIEELRADLARQLAKEKRAEARGALRGRVIETIVEGLEVPLPSAMVSQELEYRVGRIASQAEQYGLELEQFLQLTGTSPDDLIAQLREQAEETVRAQIVIDAIGREAGLEVTQEDLEAEIHRQAGRLGHDAGELAEFMTAPERLPALVADTFRRKAIDHILEHVQVLSAPPEDDADLEPPEAEEQAAAGEAEGAEEDDTDSAS